jgi:hypothetical protein
LIKVQKQLPHAAFPSFLTKTDLTIAQIILILMESFGAQQKQIPIQWSILPETDPGGFVLMNFAQQLKRH